MQRTVTRVLGPLMAASGLLLVGGCTPPAPAHRPAPAKSATPKRALPKTTSSWPLPKGATVFVGLVERVAPYDTPCHRGVWVTVHPLAVLSAGDSDQEVRLLDIENKPQASADCADMTRASLHESSTRVIGSARRFSAGQVLLFVSRPTGRFKTGTGLPTLGTRLENAGDISEVPVLARQVGPTPSGLTLMAATPTWKLDGKVARDTVTGLMWERGTSKALPYHAAEKYCASLELGGHDNWRLPRFGELVGIADHSRTQPALDTNVFGTEPEGLLWGDAEDFEPWAMTFGDGTVHSTHYDDPGPNGHYLTRCVRDHAAPALSYTRHTTRFRRVGETIVDSAAGRVWQRHLSETKMPFDAAKGHCAALALSGHDDWRLPTIRELLSLSLNNIAFVEPEDSDSVWSATRSGDEAAFIQRSLGSAGHWTEPLTEPEHVICVRAATAVSVPSSPAASPTASRYPNDRTFAAGGNDNGKRHGAWSFFRDGGGRLLSATYEGDAVHGEVTAFYEHGGKMATWSMHRGAIVGTLTLFNENGTKSREVSTRDGRAHGVVRSYSVEGSLEVTETLEAGQRQGLVTYFDEGVKVLEETYAHGIRHGRYAQFEGGKLTEEGKFVDGLRHGPWIAHYVTGELHMRADYEHGTGTMKVFYKSGKRSVVVSYKQGKLHGKNEGWYENGQRRYVFEYENGRQVGQQRRWHENGQLEEKGQFDAKGRKVGVWTEWHANGKKDSEQNFDDKPLRLYLEWDEEGRIQYRGHYDAKGRKHGAWLFYTNGKRAIQTSWDHGTHEGERYFDDE